MAVCSFIGDMDLYDPDMYLKVCAAVNGIVTENSEITFLFYAFNQMDSFMNICLRAALEAKSHFYQKVTIALVLDEPDYEKFKEQDLDSLPLCMVDRVILPFASPSKRSEHVNHHRKIQRWIIRESTHILSYLYRQFFRAENQLLDYAESHSITIIDLTDKDTGHFIDKNITLLSEKEQKVIQIIKAGHTCEETGTLLGVSKTRVSQILIQSGRTLRKYAKRRLMQELFHRRKQSPLICSILPMENMTQEGILSFFYTSMFLNRVYGPVQFRVCGNEDEASFSRLLKLFAEFLSTSKNSKNCSKELKRISEIIGELFRSCNIEQETLQEEELLATIEQADFCICSLSASPISEKIWNYISAKEHVMLLDVSKGLPEIERTLQ